MIGIRTEYRQCVLLLSSLRLLRLMEHLSLFFLLTETTLQPPVDPEHGEAELNAFASFDNDTDGNISLEEIKAVFQSLDVHLSASQMHDWFNAVDVDGDGVLDSDEFSGAMQRISEEIHTEKSILREEPDSKEESKGYKTGRILAIILIPLSLIAAAVVAYVVYRKGLCKRIGGNV